MLYNVCGISEETQCYHIMSIALFGRYRVYRRRGVYTAVVRLVLCMGTQSKWNFSTLGY